MKIRRAYHAVISVFLWAVFLYYWNIVSHRDLGYSTMTALIVLGFILLAAYLWTAFWILHNLRLSRRFTERRKRRSTSQRDFSKDFLGRWVRINTITSIPQASDFEALKKASYIEIDTSSGTKLYHTYRMQGTAR